MDEGFDNPLAGLKLKYLIGADDDDLREQGVELMSKAEVAALIASRGKPVTDPVPQTVTPADIIAKARSLKGQIVGDSQQIVDMARAIGAAWTDMASYVAILGPTTEWCGIFVAYVLTLLGIRPAYTKNSSDYDDFAWADAPIEGHWGALVTREQAQPGDIVVLRVPHHITILDADNGDGTFQGTGGNQGGSPGHVTTATFQWGNIRGIIRAPLPSGEPAPIVLESDPAKRPIIKLGDVGPYVVDLKTRLGLPVNFNFDAATDAAVRAYQTTRGLPDVDGEVGPDTWGELISGSPVKPPVNGAGALSADLVAKIAALAGSSALAHVNWTGRGVAPLGYVKGMAVAFAKAYLDLKAGGSAALAMSAPPTTDATKDALLYYGVTGLTSRALTLRALFSLLIGLGMRESSGNCFEGRDQSADNFTADTAEAGLFQQSWNSRAASPELPKLLASWSANPSDGFLSIFREGVGGSMSANEGSGEGVQFQALCKSKPCFAVECAAVGLRTIGGGPAPYGHWGPIRARAAELRPEADTLLSQVQAVVDAIPAKPIDPIIIIPDPKPEKPMPDPTTVDQAMAKIRPIVASVATSQPPSKEDIRKYLHEMTAGSGPVPLLPAPPTQPDPAATVVTPPANPSGVRTDIAVGTLGLGGALAAWLTGVLSDPQALTAAITTIVAAVKGRDILKATGSAIQTGAQKALGVPPAPPSS